MLEKIVDDVYKITGVSNVYFLKKENILIDTGFSEDKELLKFELSKIISLDKIKTIIFTHLHYDHIGNFDLFKNSDFYASKEEIDDLKADRFGTLLNKQLLDVFNIKLKNILQFKLPSYLEIISTPGHTKGSICIFDSKRKILFSGDTLFDNDFEVIGRMDLPTSVPEKMSESLNKLKKLDFIYLCSGHDY